MRHTDSRNGPTEAISTTVNIHFTAYSAAACVINEHPRVGADAS